MLIIKKEENNIIHKDKFSTLFSKYEKLLRLTMTGNNNIPAPAVEGTPVKKLSRKGLLGDSDKTLNLANLKQQQMIKISVTSHPILP